LRPVSNPNHKQETTAWWNVSRPKNSFCQEVVTTKRSPGRFFTSTTKDSKGEDDESVATASLSDVTSDDLDLVQEAVKESADFLSGIPGTNQGGGKKLAIVFTCTVCDTRSAKRFTEKAYRNGVVLVRCPGCENQHLIADRLGFFEDKADGGWDIEKGMAEMGDRVIAVTEDNVLELTLTDIIGKDRATELEKSFQQVPDTEAGK
jgi:protein import protein ZIM17